MLFMLDVVDVGCCLCWIVLMLLMCDVVDVGCC